MKKILVSLFSVLILICCKENQNKKEEKKSDKAIENTDPSKNIERSELAKKWLITAIEDNFNKKGCLIEIITTKQYAAYKNDAIMVYSGENESLSPEEFANKWKSKFDTKYAGLSSGFLISGQDYGKIKVSTCKLLKNNNTEYVFETIIQDVELKVDYKREIKVIPTNNSFLISDVKEYN